jgi:3',5'-cyclic AMP phosphodiesterase CpdA
VPTRILHVSDLHLGAHRGSGDASVRQALETLVERVSPELLVATGDLTHRGARAQYDSAAELLGSTGLPLLVVPGNHDAPHAFPRRFTHPWDEFEHHWTTTEPVCALPGVHAVGLNSVRLWRHQSGGLGEQQLAQARHRMQAAEPGALRLVAFHHHLVGAPWRTRKRPLIRRRHVLASLAESGAELIVGGHVHQAAISERSEFDRAGDGRAGPVISIVPGIGQPRPNRPREARGAAVYSCDERSITIETYTWRPDGWSRTAERVFPRSPRELV